MGVASEDQVVLITGSTDGLGRQVALDLAKTGATVLAHGRSARKGVPLLTELHKEGGNNKAQFYEADLASLDAVRNLSSRVMSEQKRLTCLVNNAGIGIGGPHEGRAESKDGFELRFAVNFLAPYLLTHLLLPLLKQSSPARIVNVASAGQQAIDFNNVMLEHGYNGGRAYSQSKLALIMFTFTLADELKGTGVTANALHPASLMPTKIVTGAGLNVMSTIADGAAATEHLILSPALETITGRYFDQMAEAKAKPQAYDRDSRQRLGEIAERLTAMEPIRRD